MGLVSWWLLATSVAAQGEEKAIVLPQPLPATIDRIEVIWSDDEEPTVLINQLEPPQIHAERWTGQAVSLKPRAEQLRPFGTCRVTWQEQEEEVRFRFQGASGAPCGVSWFLDQPEEPVNVLSFHLLRLAGKASGTIELGVADRVWWKRQDHVSCVTVNGPFEADVSLARLIDRIDLRELVAVTVTAVALPAELTIKKAWFEASPIERPGPMKRGLWVWNLQKAHQQADQVVKACRSIGCRRLSVQLPSPIAPEGVWQDFLSLVRRWQDEGIEVYALDGSPEATLNPHPLLAALRRLTADRGDALPAGLQVDIEPYLLPDAGMGLDRYRDYLATLARIRRALPSQMPLSVVVPFWFTSVVVDGRPLAQLVFAVADEVVVMNYRSDMATARVLIEDWGRYGLLFGKPLWGAIETRPLSDERHLVLQRVDRREEATAFLDCATSQLVLAKPSPSHRHVLYLKKVAEYVVFGERLSYAGRSKEMVAKALEQWEAEAASLGLAGLMIHDWEGYEQLPGASPLSSTSLNGGGE